MKLTESRIIQEITEYFGSCDADELARIAGEIFGGECFPVIKEHKSTINGWVDTEIVYDFEPNKMYGGAFMDIDPSIKPEWY